MNARALLVQSATELAFIVKDIPTVRGNLIPRALRGSSMRMSTKMPMDDVTDLSNDRLTPLFYRGAYVTFSVLF